MPSTPRPVGQMPDIGSPQFEPWLRMQDPVTQQAIMRAMGMDMASGNPVSAQGTFAPEISDMAFDLPQMIGGIPLSTNSKGEPNPYNVETQAKRLNFGQDLTGSGGLGNNMLSWITGPQATDPTAWTPTKKGVGDPMTFNNLSYVEALAGAGSDDYLSFMADLMLNKGMTGPAAFATLKDTVKQGKASPGLLASLPTAVPSKDQAAGIVEPPDLTAGGTEADFNQAFNTSALLDEANNMFKGVAQDLALQKTSGYYDPTTKQYYKGYEEQKTEQMQAADKLGLAYPTAQYNDPKYVDMMQQQAFGLAPGQAQAEADQRQADIDRLSGLVKPAQQASDKASGNFEALMKAWNDNFQAPAQPVLGAPAQPFRSFDNLQAPSANALGGGAGTMAGQPFGLGRPGVPSPPQDSAHPYVAAFNGVRPDVPLTGSAALAPAAPPKIPDDWKVVARDAQGNPLLYDTGLGSVVTAQGVGAVNDPEVLSKVASAEWEPKGSATKTQSTKPKVRVTTSGDVSLATPLNFTSLWNPDLLGSQTRELQAGDVGTAKTAADKKRKDYITAKYAPQQRKELSGNELDRAKLAAQMSYLAYQGRTPLNDQLAARSQTVRNMLGY